ncbi:unnamed protein product [Mytilus edulis]|uniref:C2H2-type domain-containing protein n=1 Tax=Mytilus edulis TaxID=6550 RepID=A0A8S3V0K4_MYTED|nr:unnamed protein product [Mytilus edulis]
MARLTIFVSTIFLILSLINTTRQDEDCPRGSMHCVRSSITVLRCGKGVQCVRIRTPITHVTCGPWPSHYHIRMPDQEKTHQCSGGCGAHYHISYDSEGVRRRKNRQRLGRRRTFLRNPQGMAPERPPGYQWGSMPNMDDNTVLEDIINCFTSIDQLLTFANTYGLIDDTYVISRLEHLRREANSFHLTCSICHKAFSTHVNYELHKLEHDIIEEFNLSLFDDAHSSVNYMDTTPEKLNFSKTRRRTLNEKIINNESSTNKKMRLSSQTEAGPSFQYANQR